MYIQCTNASLHEENIIYHDKYMKPPTKSGDLCALPLHCTATTITIRAPHTTHYNLSVGAPVKKLGIENDR